MPEFLHSVNASLRPEIRPILRDVQNFNRLQLFIYFFCVKYHMFGIISRGQVLKSFEMWSPDQTAPVRTPRCRWTEEAALLYETCLSASGEVANQRARRASEQVSPVWGSLKRLCVLSACSVSDLSHPKTPLNTEKRDKTHRLWRLEVFWFCVSPASACLPARVAIKRTFTLKSWIWWLQVKSSSQKMRFSRCLSGWRTVCSAPVCRVER